MFASTSLEEGAGTANAVTEGVFVGKEKCYAV